VLSAAPGLRFAARYELARACWRAGDGERARGLFRALAAERNEAGTLPLSWDYWLALGPEAAERVRRSAAGLLRDGRLADLLRLARGCVGLEEYALAEELVAPLRGRLEGHRDRFALTLEAAELLGRADRARQAEVWLGELARVPEYARDPALWRRAARLAERQHRGERQLACLERALELEYRRLPDVLDVAAVRADYRALLALLERHGPRGGEGAGDAPARRVARAADRWRSLDPDGGPAALWAARLLGRLGQGDLAWEYATTPLAVPAADGGPARLARWLAQEGQHDLAERAYDAACEAAPDDAALRRERSAHRQRLAPSRDAGR
jgi:hypothetical protein